MSPRQEVRGNGPSALLDNPEAQPAARLASLAGSATAQRGSTGPGDALLPGDGRATWCEVLAIALLPILLPGRDRRGPEEDLS
jgi:hypothetical protein